jgi:hypothetical protein
MASNLPPGVSEGMIPGNRPEDLADEEFWEALLERLPKGASAQLTDAIEIGRVWVLLIAQRAREIGYAEKEIEVTEREQARYVDPWNAPARDRLDAIRGLVVQVNKRLDAHAHMECLEASEEAKSGE